MDLFLYNNNTYSMREKTFLKIGIVGIGTISDIHAQAIARAGNAKLISVFSRSERKAGEMGEKYNIKGHTSWEEFISEPELDAVSICTPSGNHLDYGELAARAGKNVIVEKPLEVRIERAKSLIQICKENNVALAVIYQSRFIPGMQKLKVELDDQVIGKLFMGNAFINWFRNQDYYDSGVWRGTLALDGGGVLINQAIHTIDLLQWFMGDVESVYGSTATMTHERMEGEDNVVAVIKFKSGAMGVITGSTSVQPAQPRRIELYGEKGSVLIKGDDIQVISQGLGTASGKDNDNATGASSPLAGFSTIPHKKQFEAIAEAIIDGREPPVSGEESLKSLAIVQAIYESSKTKLPVLIDKFI
jgi:predicted dehydrogenase